MNYSIIHYGYFVLGGTSLNYWGNCPSLPGETLGRNTLADYILKTIRTLKFCHTPYEIRMNCSVIGAHSC